MYTRHMGVMAGSALQIRIDVNAAEPVYRQVAAQFRTLMVEGALRPGDVLPPVRKLALDLAVHFNTIAEAYRLLAEEGFLDVAHGRAARVAERRPPRASAADVDGWRLKLRRMMAEMKAGGLTAARIRKEVESLLESLEK